MPERLRIGMTSYYLPSCSKIGVGYQVHALANEMVDRGHHVDVHSVCPPSPGARYRTVTHPITGSMRTFRWAGRVRSVDWGRYDVLHAHGDDYWLLGPGARDAHVHVRTLHGSCFDEALHIHGAKERVRMAALGLGEVLATAVADVSVAVSPGTRRWFPWVREVIPNGVDLRRFHPDPSRRSPSPIVLFVGTWHGRKRGSLLAEVIDRDVRPSVPDIRLVMVSEDAPPSVPAWVESVGRVDDETLADLYRQAWVFALPSSYEGFGIPYVEAMASGLPVVATPNPGSSYVTDEGRAGVLADDADLGAALRHLLTNTATRDAVGQAGLARSTAFSLGGVAERYETLYAQVAERRT